VRNLQRLRQLWDNRDFVPVMHNAKFDLTATEYALGRSLSARPFHDTILQAHILINHHPSHRLKQLAWELANVPVDDEKKVRQFCKDGGNYSMVPEELMQLYQERDAERTMLLHLFFMPKILARREWREIYAMEIDLVRTTMQMERRGMMLCRKACTKLIARLEARVDSVLDEIEAFAGERLNPDKPTHLFRLLFDYAGLPILARTKTKLPCTNKATLAQLREAHPHPAIEMLVKYRSWSRGITMLRSYMNLADGNDIIYPNIRTCGAITGRESSSNPNLQNVAKSEVLLNPYPVPARLAFRPRPGYVNFHLDYSGQEMRLLVHYSGEPVLIDALRKGEDVHGPGGRIFYVDSYDPTGPQRGAVKNCNFAISYGAGLTKVATVLGLSLAVAAPRYKLYKATFPRLVGLAPLVANTVRQLGYVETYFGRRLHVPRSKAYMGTNYLIQGTGAGITKRAQNRVRRYLNKATGGEAQILLPIHDEIVLEYPRKRLADARHVLRHIVELMEAFDLRVPLAVDVNVATADWEHKQVFDIGG